MTIFMENSSLVTDEKNERMLGFLGIINCYSFYYKLFFCLQSQNKKLDVE